MKCFANKREVKLNGTAVLPPPYHGFKNCRICRIEADGKTDFEFEYDCRVQSVKVRPLSLGIKADFSGNKVSFTLDKGMKVSVEINEELDETVLVFVSEKKEYDFSGYDNVIVFDKPEYDIDELAIDKDNTVVYIAHDTVVNGRIVAKNVNNLKICGSGILSMAKYTRGLPEDMTRCLDILGCKNVTVEDICIFDSCNWSFRLNGCDDVEVNNIKVIGCRGNSDGCDVCGSRNVYVHDCFIRTYDDCLVLKAFDTGDVENILFEKCTLWNDMARPIEVGVELRCEQVKNITYRNIDIIHSLTCYPMFGIHHGDRANLSDIHFENIRIEHAPGAQLFDFRITDSVWNEDSKKGRIKNVTVNDIYLVGEEGKDFRNLSARIDGFSEEADIDGVTIGNIVAFGKKVKSAGELGLDVIGHCKNITFADEVKNEILTSQIVLSKEFEMMNDGKYHGKVKLVINNGTKSTVSGVSGINVFPKNTAEFNRDKLCYSLEPGMTAEKEYEIVTGPGKYAIESYSDKIELKASVFYFELAYPLTQNAESAMIVDFTDCYGDNAGGVKFALKNGWFEVNSELLKDYDIVLYSAKPSELFDNQILFSAEESYFGEAPSVKWKNNKYMPAPEIGNHWEITYVFLNQPKVEKIYKTTFTKNINGVMRVPAASMGIDKDAKHIWIEAELKKHTGKNMPYTLFRSTLPSETAHMFCDFVIE